MTARISWFVYVAVGVVVLSMAARVIPYALEVQRKAEAYDEIRDKLSDMTSVQICCGP